jgi:hypothetical protein
MARWDDLAVWRGPTVNQGPAMVEQRGLVIHIAEGYYEGTIAYQKNPDVNVSSHFVLAGPRDARWGVPDGKLAQVVDTAVAAWTQRAGNGHWLSVECSGFTPDSLSAAQVESVAQLLARCHRVYGVPLQIAINPDGYGLGHHSMGTDGGSVPTDTWTGPTWGHTDCPGPNIIHQKPQIVERAIEIINGGPMSANQEYNADSHGWALTQLLTTYPVIAGGAPPAPTVVVGNALAAALARLEVKVDALAEAVAAIGSTNPDVAAILAGVQNKLDAQTAELEASLAQVQAEAAAAGQEARDAVGDLAEGGAAQVRADA